MTEEEEYKILISNVKTVLDTMAGKAVIWEILGMCGLYTDFSDSDSKSIGRRSIGLDILQLLESADSRIYPKLLLDKQD